MLFLLALCILITGIDGFNSSCVPKKGYTGLIIGQDFESIVNYTTAFEDVNSHPFGVASYTSLIDLAGLDKATDYGSGIQDASALMDKYPGSALQLGLYLVDSLDMVISQQLDVEIDKLTDFLLSLNSPVR